MSGESATESVIPWGESCPRELGVCQVPAGSLRCKSPRAQAAGSKLQKAQTLGIPVLDEAGLRVLLP